MKHGIDGMTASRCLDHQQLFFLSRRCLKNEEIVRCFFKCLHSLFFLLLLSSPSGNRTGWKEKEEINTFNASSKEISNSARGKDCSSGNLLTRGCISYTLACHGSSSSSSSSARTLIHVIGLHIRIGIRALNIGIRRRAYVSKLSIVGRGSGCVCVCVCEGEALIKLVSRVDSWATYELHIDLERRGRTIAGNIVSLCAGRGEEGGWWGPKWWRRKGRDAPLLDGWK